LQLYSMAAAAAAHGRSHNLTLVMALMICVQVLLVIMCCSSMCLVKADPDPLTDFAPNVTTFTFKDLNQNGIINVGPGGRRAALNITIFPALISQGITVVRFELLPCGTNPPHTHPRASELLFLVSGGPLLAGFVDTSGVAHLDIIHAGDVTIFPRALLHFETNLGTETAVFISGLNSQNPGTLNAGFSEFQIPDIAIASALYTNIPTLDKIRANISEHEAGNLEALQKSPLAHCVPGKNISDFDNVLRTMGIGNRKHLLQSLVK
jgi:quercetin dioxygenase-like cupin family protein